MNEIPKEIDSNILKITEHVKCSEKQENTNMMIFMAVAMVIIAAALEVAGFGKVSNDIAAEFVGSGQNLSDLSILELIKQVFERYHIFAGAGVVSCVCGIASAIASIKSKIRINKKLIDIENDLPTEFLKYIKPISTANQFRQGR